MRRPSLLFALLLTAALAACGAGDEEVATFEVEGSTAVMTGVIGSSTPDAVRALLDENPDVDTISLLDVPGSEDDESNLEASRLIRAAGIATHVPPDGSIASGGVDFFLAGTERSWDDGAQFGVHSWSDGSRDGADVARDDPAHQLYLDFYDEMGVSEDFYWFTLDAAPAASIHFMTASELDDHGFATGARQ